MYNLFCASYFINSNENYSFTQYQIACDLKSVTFSSQMGKVVESAADFYHARIPKKQRKATLLDEVMADADLRK